MDQVTTFGSLPTSDATQVLAERVFAEDLKNTSEMPLDLSSDLFELLFTHSITEMKVTKSLKDFFNRSLFSSFNPIHDI